MTELYPLMMQPSFRSGPETPWGGQALREKFGKDTTEEVTGESLEVSVLPGHESRILNGKHRGKTLGEVFSLWGEKLTGGKGKDFPLLLKLLDTRQALSVQVHPDDAYALLHEGKKGKSEAWYILDAVPGARLVCGVDTKGEDLRAVVNEGRLEECLRWTEVRPGDVFYIPSGTVHALGPGIQCYEIQESSDITYRFWDWGRTGKDGKPRPLHVEQALAVTKAGFVPEPTESVPRSCPGGTIMRLVEDPHFRLSEVGLNGTMILPAGEMLILTPAVHCTVSWGEGEEKTEPYRSVLIPAHMQEVRVSGSGRMLVSCAL